MASPEHHQTIDLRKESRSTKYDQRFIAHYCGHHMQCGNSPMMFEHLNMLKYLETKFSATTFGYDMYCNECCICGLEPAKEYKPMTYFDAYIHIGIGDRKGCAPDITTYKSIGKTSVSLTMIQMSADNEMYSITLPAHNMKHAFEQICAICKENFG